MFYVIIEAVQKHVEVSMASIGAGKIKIEDVREKLRNLRIYLPSPRGQEHTYYFADYLAEKLEDRDLDFEVPEKYLMRVELAFRELASGVDGLTGQWIAHRAADRVPSAKIFIQMDMGDIADIIFPPEFAAKVKATDREVRKETARAAKKRSR